MVFPPAAWDGAAFVPVRITNDGDNDSIDVVQAIIRRRAWALA